MDIREQKLRELSTETSHAIEMLDSKTPDWDGDKFIEHDELSYTLYLAKKALKELDAKIYRYLKTRGDE
jgi:hypothetical protein